MAEHMTARWLTSMERKPPPETRQEIPDAAMPGLYLVRQPSGAMSWAVRYRHGGKPRKMTLGSYPALGLADARTAAGKALRAVAEGVDPGAEKVATRAAAKEPQPAADRDLLRTVVADFLKRAVQGKNRTAGLVESIFARQVLPLWAERKVQSISRRDVIELTDALVDRGEPYAANRLFAALRRFFNWAVERGIVDRSPCVGLKPPGTETSRDRVLADDELRLFWMATDTLGYPFRQMFRIMLLTAQRREEVAGLRRDEIEGTAWTIPGERAKNGTPNLVPLSKDAIAELSTCPVIGKKGYIFTTTGESSASGYSKAKSRLDDGMLRIMRAEARERGEDPDDIVLVPWRLHDLRRTAATGMARLRIAPHVIEAVLNHRSGQISGVAAVYNRYAYQDEKAEALAAWANFVRSIVEPKPASNVVELAVVRSGNAENSIA